MTRGLYIHVPFCAARCGYCDFNTYTSDELGAAPGASQDRYVAAAQREIELAAAAWPGLLDTVFFGGGTPSLLPDEALASLVDAARVAWGFGDVEVSLEANPDTVTPARARAWADAGVTRVSLGMQSANRSVLATLERTHAAERMPDAVEAVKAAGLGASVDLIYGTPGESVEAWQESVQAAIALAPDHVSAYALTIESGTKMGVQRARGLIANVDGDDQARKYELVDDMLTAAGYGWYEISNWAITTRDASRHNLGYWSGGQWWGVGPGAHSFTGRRRWWNVKHPTAYSQAVLSSDEPLSAVVAGEEHLTADDVAIERVMLGIRTSRGLPLDAIPAVDTVDDLASDGLVDVDGDRVVLTRAGRLLCDTVVLRLLGH